MSTKRLVLQVAGREGVQTVVLPGSFVIPRSRWNGAAIAVEDLVAVELVDASTLDAQIAEQLAEQKAAE